MAKIEFTYDYPYFYFHKNCKYGVQWSNSQITINGNKTYPAVFNNAVPNCSHIEVNFDITNTGNGSVLGIQWEFKIYRKYYGWYVIDTFIMPNNGHCSIVADINGYAVTQFACVPKTQQSSSKTWDILCSLQKLTITEIIDLSELTTGMFQYGVFANNYGLETNLTEIYANIDGVLKQATDILVNTDGELVSISPVYSAHLKTQSESISIYKFTPGTFSAWDGGELDDGSFEDGSGWMTTRGGSTVAGLNTNDAYHGSKSFAFYYAGNNVYINNAYHAVYLTPGTYKLSYYTKGISPGNVHIENSSGIRVMEGTAGGNNANWTRIDCTNELIVYNAATLYVRAVSTGTDRLIDGITLVKKGMPMPKNTVKYHIKNKRLSGDHEIRIYDRYFNPLYDGYFYDERFDLVKGQDYYITQTHYYNADESESYLQIYKED